ncbi:DUF3891 family protein [Rhodocytophaga aerolata]|uniref:DUF3891 family protein n=1 Tax=Rhodocytophaga aerolata TaxID=455078 RepID=A0ABT8R3V4_9BACT|nr:DUF3891 family protein [Rhodocytophaga aerolata]MDO1446763.1 DUF3891 family protein [Rhodocytophaga aerolata]
MIVRETPESFILIAQHTHATLSGQLAEHWKEEFFWQQPHTPEVLLAIYQHDRGWISLDEVPAWDVQHAQVFSFIGYPLQTKLLHYTRGIDEVEAMNPYAALLCSRHYCSFMREENIQEKEFVEQELKRQHTLIERMQLDDPAKQQLADYHFRILQLFDDLSLYVCINQPGVSKDEEFPFFKNGFKNSDKFAFTHGRKIEAYWKNIHTVSLLPFPLSREYTVAVPYKEVSKKDIQQRGLAEAYQIAPLQTYQVNITS